MQKVPRIRNRKHLDWLKTLPCTACGRGPCDPAHIRIGGNGGTSLKPGDDNAVPLCRDCHTKQHGGERSFWRDKLDRARDLANGLYVITGQDEMAIPMIYRFQK